MTTSLKMTDEVEDDLAKLIAMAAYCPNFEADIGMDRAVHALAAVMLLRRRAQSACSLELRCRAVGDRMALPIHLEFLEEVLS